jgi:hypothetical protein
LVINIDFPFLWISLPDEKLKTKNHSLMQLLEVRKQQSILAPALFRRFPENSRQNVNFQSQNTTTDCFLGIPDWSELLGFTAECQLLYDCTTKQRMYIGTLNFRYAAIMSAHTGAVFNQQHRKTERKKNPEGG